MYHIRVVYITNKYKYYIVKIIAVVQFLLCLLLSNRSQPADLCIKTILNYFVLAKVKNYISIIGVIWIIVFQSSYI